MSFAKRHIDVAFIIIRVRVFRFPSIFLQITRVVIAKLDAFAFKQGTLDQCTFAIAARANAAVPVDDPLPRHPIGRGPHGIADSTRCSWCAQCGGDLPIRHDPAAWNVAHENVYRIVKRHRPIVALFACLRNRRLPGRGWGVPCRQRW